MFRKAGLDPMRPPRTIEELTAYADRLVKRGEDGKLAQAGFLPAEPGWWNWGWGYLFGGRLWDGKSRITANSPENVRAFEWVQSFSEKYGASDLHTFRSGFGNFDSPQNAFMAERVAMVLQGVWMYNFVTKHNPRLEWAAAPFPHPADRPDLADMTFTGLDVLVIPRGAKHPREAFEFIRFVQSQRGMELLCMGQRKHSPLVKVSERFWREHPNPYIRLFSEMAWSKNAVNAPQVGIWTEFGQEMTNAFEEVYLLQKTPKEALDKVQARMQPKLDAYLRLLELRGKGKR
jgi:ABC-type glycerol-3-phosphate transport system substrate-binding protein